MEVQRTRTAKADGRAAALQAVGTDTGQETPRSKAESPKQTAHVRPAGFNKVLRHLMGSGPFDKWDKCVFTWREQSRALASHRAQT